MQASPTSTADHSVYLALIALAGVLAVPLTALITFLLSRRKQQSETLVGEAQSESIRAGTIVTILGQMDKMRANREDSDEAHRKIVRELEAELERSRDGEQQQRDVAAAKWREISNCFLYMELLEDKLEVPQNARYKKRTRDEIVKSVD